MKNINSLSLKMIEALDKLVSSTKGEDGKRKSVTRRSYANRLRKAVNVR